MVKLNGFSAFNSPPVLSAFNGSQPYSNAAATITIGGTKYKVFYGKVTNGIATYLSYIGVVPGDGGEVCADQAWLSHQ